MRVPPEVELGLVKRVQSDGVERARYDREDGVHSETRRNIVEPDNFWLVDSFIGRAGCHNLHFIAMKTLAYLHVRRRSRTDEREPCQCGH